MGLTHSPIPMGNCFSSSAVVPSSPPPPLPAPPPETAQGTHPTSILLPNVSYPSSFMASSFQGSRRKPTHATTPYNDDSMTSTSSPAPGVVRRVRAQSQDTASLRRRSRRDGRDNPPPSCRGDVLTSQHPDRQEMYLHQHPSDGAGPTMQRTRSVSMGVSSLQSTRSHSSGRGAWAASISSNGNGHQRVGTQPMLGLSSGTIQMLAGRPEGRSPLPFSLHSLLSDVRYAVRRFSTSNYNYCTIVLRFRILVVGKVSTSVAYHPGRRRNMHISS